MARVRAGEIQLGWREWGKGDVTVVFIHGNLASKDWIELAAPFFSSGVRVIGIDWRGWGESGRPPPAPDFSNYSMRQHALDILAALDELRIPFCHLATHSTGGIIAARMLLKQPGRFGRVFALDPLHPHLVLWGERDGGIAPEDLRTMASAMPDCRLVTVPGNGHSMNLELPALYAGYFGAWFGGL
jgi:pimeloyl-ACP methyl ester carboxylesterase